MLDFPSAKADGNEFNNELQIENCLIHYLFKSIVKRFVIIAVGFSQRTINRKFLALAKNQQNLIEHLLNLFQIIQILTKTFL